MTHLVNFTPHDVTVYAADGAVLACWPNSGFFARVVEQVRPADPLETDCGTVPCANVSYSEVIEGLPGPSAGTAYIVSRVTAAAVSREDLYFPFDEVRDCKGRILGCRGLGRFVRPDDASDA